MKKFQKSVKKLLSVAGKPIRITCGNSDKQVTAIIQPMRYKNKMYLSMGRNHLGFNDNECFLYIGPPDFDFSETSERTVIEDGERSYNVSRADKISLGSETLYIWAVLTLRIKEGSYDLG
jgi:hypothetical protein